MTTPLHLSGQAHAPAQARWKELDRHFLKPLLGGRGAGGSGNVAAHPLGSSDDDDDAGAGGRPGHRARGRCRPYCSCAI